MGQFQTYPEATGEELLSGDLSVMLVDGVTKKVKKDELKKSVNRLDIDTSAGTYTLTLADEGKYLRRIGNITVPPNSSVAWPIGAGVTIRNSHASATINLLAGAGVTLLGSLAISPDSNAVIIKIGTDTWDVVAGSGSVSGGGAPATDTDEIFNI